MKVADGEIDGVNDGAVTIDTAEVAIIGSEATRSQATIKGSPKRNIRNRNGKYPMWIIFWKWRFSFG